MDYVPNVMLQMGQIAHQQASFLSQFGFFGMTDNTTYGSDMLKNQYRPGSEYGPVRQSGLGSDRELLVGDLAQIYGKRILL